MTDTTPPYVVERSGRYVVVVPDARGDWNCGHRHRTELDADLCRKRLKKQVQP